MDKLIHGETPVWDGPRPKPVIEQEITLTEFDNGLYGASVTIKGDEYGHGIGQCTQAEAFAFIAERVSKN